MQATLIALALCCVFFFAGNMMLKLFNVDIASFAVAGAVVLFMMALEMILDVEISKTPVHKRSHTRSSGFPVAGWRGFVYHTAFAPFGVCLH